jgi:hypothetical protein
MTRRCFGRGRAAIPFAHIRAISDHSSGRPVTEAFPALELARLAATTAERSNDEPASQRNQPD